MAYPAKTWAKIKKDYETGNFSVQELQKKYRISARSIDAKISEESWQKGVLKDKIEKSIQQRYIDAFVARGVDESKIASVCDGMLAATKIHVVPSNVSGEPGFCEEVPDWRARKDGVEQVAKLTGAYAAEKSESKVKVEIQGLEDILKKVYPL